MSTATYGGILLALAATTAYNAGLIQEKRALGRMPTLDVHRVPHMIASLLTDVAWLTGFTLMLTGLACQTVALTFEPVSIVQPVLSSGIALVLVLSRLALREPLGGGEFYCVAAIAGSVVLLAFSVEGADGKAGHYASTGWMALVMIPSVLAGLLVAASSLRTRDRKHRIPVTGICYGIGTGLLYGVAALAIKALSGILFLHHTAASIATGVVSSPYLYVLAGCSVAALLLFQAALQSCRASIVVPVSSVVSSVYFMIAGTWLFHEQLPASPAKLTLRLTGIAVAGLVLIALSRQVPAQTAAMAARGTGVVAPSYLADPRRR
jgi:uncharacterized membrane protein